MGQPTNVFDRFMFGCGAGGICLLIFLIFNGCVGFQFHKIAAETKKSPIGFHCFDYRGTEATEGYYCMEYIPPSDAAIMKLRVELYESRYENDSK